MTAVSRCQMPKDQVQLPRGGRLLMRRLDLEGSTMLPDPGHRIYTSMDGDLRVIVGMEPFLRDGVPRLHVSFSHPDRTPEWETIKQVKDAFFGDHVEAAVILPKKRHYVNVHQHTHHLWEMPDEWLYDDDR